MKILKSMNTGWIICNYGIPINTSLASTRRECIDRYMQGYAISTWDQLRNSGSHACIKVKLVSYD